MKRLILLQLFLLVITTYPTIAQTDDSEWFNGCDPRIAQSIEDASERFDYGSACETYLECISSRDDFLFCQLEVADELLAVCDVDDYVCQIEALSHVGAIGIFGHPYGAGYGWQPPDVLISDFPDSFTEFSAGDYVPMLTLLERLETDDYYFHPMVHYLHALTFEMVNMPDEALAQYRTILDVIHYHSLARFTRGLLLGELGRATEASFESAWLEDFLTALAPELLSTVDLLTTRYPLDETPLSTWMKYPVYTYGASPGGALTLDVTQDSPTPVRIGIYEDLNTIVATDVTGLRYRGFTGDIPNTYALRRTETNTYNYLFPVIAGNVDSLELELRDGLIFGEELAYGGESSLQDYFIIAPADQPDPRDAFGEPTCEGGVISRLRPGMYVIHENAISLGMFEYSETPGGPRSFDRYFENTFSLMLSVTDNSTCVGNQLWWEVTDGLGTTGWMNENESQRFLLAPRYPNNWLFYCPATAPTRVYVQGQARVIAGLGANNLRAEAGTTAEIIGTIPSEAQFTVIDGPVCVEGMVWWEVEYGDLTGWTAEGEGETYWLEPVYVPR